MNIFKDSLIRKFRVSSFVLWIVLVFVWHLALPSLDYSPWQVPAAVVLSALSVVAISLVVSSILMHKAQLAKELGPAMDLAENVSIFCSGVTDALKTMFQGPFHPPKTSVCGVLVILAQLWWLGLYHWTDSYRWIGIAIFPVSAILGFATMWLVLALILLIAAIAVSIEDGRSRKEYGY